MRSARLALLVLCALCASAQASWTTLRMTGPQDPRVAVSFVEATSGDSAGIIEVWAENRLGGPVEVLLSPDSGSGITGEPLPVRTVLRGFERRLISRLKAQPDRGLRLQVVLGTPDATPRDVEYAYPLQTSELRIEQGWGGGYSHHDLQNRHAVDFAAAIGTPVIAARTGTVMEVEADFARAGLDTETFAGRANFVRIVHDDGTMALYAHLDVDGVRVRVGQRVRKGEAIGFSGNTGFTAGPHLHFTVQANRGMRLESIPFRMFGPQGILRFTESK
jgi:murein DD-endopeptidase MepM/ murein hydrolase activator NlpD